MPEIKEENANDKIRLLIIPDKDGRVVAQTLKTVLDTIYIGGHVPAQATVESSVLIPNVRTEGFKLLRNALQIENARGFLVDSDIYTAFNADTLIKYVEEADKKHYNFVLPYKQLSGNYSIFKDKTFTELTETELSKMKDWQRIEAAGLGFYYGDLPLSYEFRFGTGNKFVGEDIMFFQDNNLKPRIVKSLKLYHIKSVKI